MKSKSNRILMLALASALAPMHAAQAFTFANEAGTVTGSLDSTISVGLGKRLKDPSCSLTGDPNSFCGASANTAQWSNGDNGNLNYRKGDLFSTYVKGSHELLLKMPDNWKFMARGTWMYDFKATDTARTDFEPDAEELVKRQTRLLDLWVSKDFNIGQ